LPQPLANAFMSTSAFVATSTTLTGVRAPTQRAAEAEGHAARAPSLLRAERKAASQMPIAHRTRGSRRRRLTMPTPTGRRVDHGIDDVIGAEPIWVSLDCRFRPSFDRAGRDRVGLTWLDHIVGSAHVPAGMRCVL
jgi:hypothetical protein